MFLWACSGNRRTGTARPRRTPRGTTRSARAAGRPENRGRFPPPAPDNGARAAGGAAGGFLDAGAGRHPDASSWGTVGLPSADVCGGRAAPSATAGAPRRRDGGLCGHHRRGLASCQSPGAPATRLVVDLRAGGSVRACAPQTTAPLKVTEEAAERRSCTAALGAIRAHASTRTRNAMRWNQLEPDPRTGREPARFAQSSAFGTGEELDDALAAIELHPLLRVGRNADRRTERSCAERLARRGARSVCGRGL